jgi:lipoprotein-anchoring transpeptidase ErfK/SrfK
MVQEKGRHGSRSGTGVSQRRPGLSMWLRCNRLARIAVASLPPLGAASRGVEDDPILKKGGEATPNRMRICTLILALAAAGLLSGCFRGTPDPALSARDTAYMALTPSAEIDPIFGRYEIEYRTSEAPGTIIVETRERQLYLVLPNGRAIRYGVAVGDEAYGWTGSARLDHKAEWPSWNPSAEMRRRWPHVRPVEGGPNSPLGARALYLFEGGRDTLYRIHGTNEPEKIGQAVSSGCIRMRNIDVVDLYNRAQRGAKVIVR